MEENYIELEEEREPTRWEKVRKVLLQVGALVAILGILYLGGIYQGTFFQRTPSDTVLEPMQPLTEEEEISLPISIFVFHGEGTLGSNREEADITQLIRNSDAIWHQAHIALKVEQVEFFTKSDEEVQAFLNNPHTHITTTFDVDPDTIHIFLTRTLYGINGIAFAGGNVVAVADFTTASDFRTLAHEIGHVLGLTHVENPNRLMASGGTGTTLTREEVEQARTNATSFRND